MLAITSGIDLEMWEIHCIFSGIFCFVFCFVSIYNFLCLKKILKGKNSKNESKVSIFNVFVLEMVYAYVLEGS